MIKLTATALIHFISPVIQVTENFQKRELILNDSWIDRDNKEHPNFVLIEFNGDAMNLLDNFQPGQRVTVDAYVNGREYQGRYFNTIRGQSIRFYQPSQAAPQPTVQQMGYPQAPAYPQQSPQIYGVQAPAHAPAPAPAPAYPQQQAIPSGYPQQPAYPQQYQQPFPQQNQGNPVQPQGQQYCQQLGKLGVDQLPFTPQ